MLKDDALAELVLQRPLTPDAFDKLRAVPRGYGRSSAAAEIVAILKDVEALPKGALPALPERYRGPSPKGAVGDLIRVLLKAVSEQNGVASRIIATSDEVDALVLDDDADVPALKGWRAQDLWGQGAGHQARQAWPRRDPPRHRRVSDHRKLTAAFLMPAAEASCSSRPRRCSPSREGEVARDLQHEHAVRELEARAGQHARHRRRHRVGNPHEDAEEASPAGWRSAPASASRCWFAALNFGPM